MVQRYAVDPEGRRLSERLTAKENAALAAALARLDAPAALFDRLEPWFVALTLASIGHQQLQIDAENGPERVLSRAARERGMPIGELEGVERQIRLFDTMPEAQQMAQLRQTIGEVDRMAEMLAPLLAAWSAGNVDELVDILNTHSEQDPALHRLLFTERNAAWAEWIAQRLERPGTVFVAVGAGHLAGDDSVQAVLGARGLLAERVPRAGAATIAAR